MSRARDSAVANTSRAPNASDVSGFLPLQIRIPLARQLILIGDRSRVAVHQCLSQEHTGTPERGPEPYRQNENPEKNLSVIFAKTLVITVFGVVLYVCLGQTDRHSIADCSQTNGGNTMSRLSSKILVALILGFTALTASGCTVPLTIDPGGSGLVFM
jgi:hypothetical protein